METEELRRRIMEVLEYSPETGMFRWLKKIHHACKSGWFAGSPGGCDGNKYRYIGVFGKKYQAHRLAWLITHGDFPAGDTDHEDQDKDNNRIDNLRDATRSQNNQNRRMNKYNTSGFMGVCFSKKLGKWRSYIKVNGKQIHLGYFDDITNAVTARKAAELKYGFHPNHGMAK